jgi:hypothetical protein
VHADHLGSTTMLGKGSATSPFAGSTTRYLPFGGYRTTPAQAVTDRDFTGQKENCELGLLYYNARYYLLGLDVLLAGIQMCPSGRIYEL